MEPQLVKSLVANDCTNIAIKDNTTIGGSVTTPSFVVLEIGMYGKEKTFVKIDASSDSVPTLTEWLQKVPYLINEVLFDPTNEGLQNVLKCGIIHVRYHWFYSTAQTLVLSTSIQKLGVGNNGMIIAHSTYVNGEIYYVDKAKSKTNKLYVTDNWLTTGTHNYVYGYYKDHYIINDCLIRKGIVEATGQLSSIACDSASFCVSDDTLEVDRLLYAKMQLNAAYIKNRCGDYRGANAIISALCKDFNTDCADVPVISTCSNCS